MLSLRSLRARAAQASPGAGIALMTMLVIAAGPRASFAASAITSPPHAFDMRAQDGVDVATATARGWQTDALPVHVEAADSLHDDGSAAAWTYVYWSPSARLARGYTVRRGGAVTVADFAFPFDPPALEGGWQDATDALERALKDPRAVDARRAGALAAAVLTRGLAQATPVARDAMPRTTWLLAFGTGTGAGRELVVDALRGVVLEVRASTAAEAADAPAGAVVGGRAGLPPWLATHATLALGRLGPLRDRDVTAARARWLSGREGASLSRLSAQDAALDSLGKARHEAEGAALEQRLKGLAAWRAEGAAADSQLAQSAMRVDACLRDLGSEGPTGIAVYLSVAEHARPARVSVFVDGVEATRTNYGDAEWRALDAGAWAEAARLSVRPGRREIRVDIESADHRIERAAWQETIAPGRLALLHLALSGMRPEAGGPAPRLELLSATTP